jgi:hypothetical protein
MDMDPEDGKERFIKIWLGHIKVGGSSPFFFFTVS